MADAPAVRGAVAAHLRTIGAAPRPAGGAGEDAARRHAAAALRAAGYDVVEVPFTYSDVPGHMGTPIAGAWTAATLGATALAGARGRPRLALATLGAGVGALAAIGWWMARAGTARLPWSRRAGINLVATRGVRAAPSALPGEGVRVWLVAHLDTKLQPVPMVARVGGVSVALACAAGAGAVALAEVWRGRRVVPAACWTALGAAGIVAAVPIAATTVGTASDGALDNASGVAAVLGAAELLGDDAGPSGVLLTSAEELGLAGAHAWADAWARAGRPPAIAFNCDGVDDAGPLTVLRGARVGAEVARALDAVAARGRMAPRVRRIPPGLLVDAVALGAAGWQAVTVSRGSWGTLARVHTRCDTLAHLRGDGLPGAVELLVALARACGRGDGSGQRLSTG